MFGTNIEIKQVLLPVKDIENVFGFLFRKENIEVLYDPENIVPDLLNSNEKFLKKGNSFSEEDRLARYSFLMSSIDGMKDSIDDKMLVFRKKADFYDRAVPAWFRFKHREFKPSDYEALPRIKKDDPEFYELLETFVKGDTTESIKSAEKITQLLFSDLAA